MTKENLITLLAGALIVAALCLRVLADNVNPKRYVIDTTDGAEVISSETMSPKEIQAALKEMDESDKICSNGKGSLVKCPEIDEDTICIRARYGAPSGSGVIIDCEKHQPIPTDADSDLRALEAEAIPAD